MRLARVTGLLGLTCAILFVGCASTPARKTQKAQIQAFVKQMVSDHGFRRGQIELLLADAHRQQKIIDAMNHPAEALPWYKYRAIFLGQKRIRQGVAFMRKHRETLEEAQAKYGVPPDIITAILGVETRYGRQMGSLRVIDALYTLAFFYPSRQKFFTRELAQFLILTRNQGIDPLKVKGSYAGAMGEPQFIASTYRHYAVDFNGDGKTDLWHEPADAIGSVANYLSKNGWKRGQPIAVRANVGAGVKQATLQGLKPNQLKTSYRVSALAGQGIHAQRKLPQDTKVGLLRLKGAAVPQFWLGAHNFYVITTYNHSPLYAMAVYQLARAIDRASRAAAHQPGTVAVENATSSGD